MTIAQRRVLGRDEASAERSARENLACVGLTDKGALLLGPAVRRPAAARRDRARAMGAELMVFDEPTSALDPELVGDVLAVMRPA